MKKILVFGITILSLLFGCGGGSASTSQQEQTRSISTLLVPLYSYPTTYRDDHQRLAQLRTQKEIMVIINPDNGPGNSKDVEFENLIISYKNAGMKVLGYVFTSYTSRNQSNVKADIEKYLQFYPQIDGFFLDEVSNKPEDINYYSQLYQYIKTHGRFLVVINPGTKVPQEYYNVADKVVVFEQSIDFLYNQYGLTKANPKDCFLVYGVRDIGKAKELLLYLVSHDAKCAYIVNEDPPSWFRLSPYMDLLIE